MSFLMFVGTKSATKVKTSKLALHSFESVIDYSNKCLIDLICDGFKLWRSCLAHVLRQNCGWERESHLCRALIRKNLAKIINDLIIAN